MYVSFGNKKLPKDTLIWNIPAVITCPGKTEFCRVSCYALKAERLYKNVKACRTQNLKDSVNSNFVERMNTILWDKQSKYRQVRIHESGDFYNQEYLNKWFLIASMHSGTTFYAYTKSFHLDFSQKPGNFVLIASFDKASTPMAKALYENKKQYFDNTFSIVDRKSPADCIQDCTACNNCWVKKGMNITINQH